MTGALSFDSNDLQTFDPVTQTGILTNSIDYASIPANVLALNAIAHADMSAITDDSTPSKVITISGAFAGSTPAEFDDLLDTFKGYFTGKNKNLDIQVGSKTRRFVATLNGTGTITVSENKKYAQFTIVFVCIIPYGVDTTNTVALNATGRTDASYSDDHTFIGSAENQLPVVTLTLSAVSATGMQSLLFGNQDTGQNITVARSTWTAGDVVVISMVDYSVTVNGVPYDFDGAFPEFTKGSHTMLYSDTFTSRTFNEDVEYAARYE